MNSTAGSPRRWWTTRCCSTSLRAHKSGQSAQAEIALADERTLNANVTPIEGVGQVAVMQDITHFPVLAVQDQCKELDRIKTELVSTVSHDLRSPLTSISGCTFLFQQKSPRAECGPLGARQRTHARAGAVLHL